MSMLIRTGTIIRKPTRKSSVRRTKSAGSANSGGHARTPDKGDLQTTIASVPTSPVAKLHHLYTDHSLNNSPAKASVTTTTSTVVSVDDGRLAYKTYIDRTLSCDTGNQNTVVQIEEASIEADNVCDFLCTASQIVCSSSHEMSTTQQMSRS